MITSLATNQINGSYSKDYEGFFDDSEDDSEWRIGVKLNPGLASKKLLAEIVNNILVQARGNVKAKTGWSMPIHLKVDATGADESVVSGLKDFGFKKYFAPGNQFYQVFEEGEVVAGRGRPSVSPASLENPPSPPCLPKLQDGAWHQVHMITSLATNQINGSYSKDYEGFFDDSEDDSEWRIGVKLNPGLASKKLLAEIVNNILVQARVNGKAETGCSMPIHLKVDATGADESVVSGLKDFGFKKYFAPGNQFYQVFEEG